MKADYDERLASYRVTFDSDDQELVAQLTRQFVDARRLGAVGGEPILRDVYARCARNYHIIPSLLPELRDAVLAALPRWREYDTPLREWGQRLGAGLGWTDAFHFVDPVTGLMINICAVLFPPTLYGPRAQTRLTVRVEFDNSLSLTKLRHAQRLFREWWAIRNADDWPTPFLASVGLFVRNDMVSIHAVVLNDEYAFAIDDAEKFEREIDNVWAGMMQHSIRNEHLGISNFVDDALITHPQANLAVLDGIQLARCLSAAKFLEEKEE